MSIEKIFNPITFARKIVKWLFNNEQKKKINSLCREGDKINWFSKLENTHTHLLANRCDYGPIIYIIIFSLQNERDFNESLIWNRLIRRGKKRVKDNKFRLMMFRFVSSAFGCIGGFYCCFVFIDLPCKLSFARLMEEFSILFKTHHLPYRYNNDVDRNGYFWLLICASTFVDTHAHSLAHTNCVEMAKHGIFYALQRKQIHAMLFLAVLYMSIGGDITVEKIWWCSQTATPATFQNVYNATPTKIHHIKTFSKTFFYEYRREKKAVFSGSLQNKQGTETSADFIFSIVVSSVEMPKLITSQQYTRRQWNFWCVEVMQMLYFVIHTSKWIKTKKM